MSHQWQQNVCPMIYDNKVIMRRTEQVWVLFFIVITCIDLVPWWVVISTPSIVRSWKFSNPSLKVILQMHKIKPYFTFLKTGREVLWVAEKSYWKVCLIETVFPRNEIETIQPSGDWTPFIFLEELTTIGFWKGQVFVWFKGGMK